MTVVTTSIETKAPVRLGRVDITDELVDAVARSGASEGIAVAFCRHTTCVLLLNEWESGAEEDLARTLGALAPLERYYAHDDMSRRTQNIASDNEPANGAAHILAALAGGSSQLIPFRAGKLELGTWQRLMLLELDDPRPREVLFSILT